MEPCCGAPARRRNRVLPLFWLVAGGLLLAIALSLPLDQPAVTLVATALFIVGGLPHGAYDLALLQKTVAPGLRVMALVVGGYIAIAMGMVLLWLAQPIIALSLFLIIAAVHFGEDWQVLEEPLLRFAAGAAVITVPAISHPADVGALFAAMSDDRARLLVQIIGATAPVTLLVAAVGIVVAWRQHDRLWAAATSLCLAVLVIAPPVVGFALFFVLLHSPLHLERARAVLSDMSRTRWLATGALLSIATLVGWFGLRRLLPFEADAGLTAQAFQMLAAVAVPHLVLSRWLEKRLEAVGDRGRRGRSDNREPQYPS